MERLTALRAEGYGRLSAAGCVRFAQGATAPAALRVADCRSAAMLIKSALRIHLSVSYGMIGILVISHLRWLSPLWCLTAPPSRPAGKRVTRFSGRLCSPTNRVPLPPRKRVAQSRFLKPQISILKSQISPSETFRPPSPLYRQRAGKAWRTFFHSPNARIPWKRGRKSRSHHVTSVSPVHRK